jgi:hypothetical protein
MSWHGGTRVMRAIIEASQENVPDDDARKRIYSRVMPALEAQDWNEHPDLFGTDPVYDTAVRERHGNRWYMD